MLGWSDSEAAPAAPEPDRSEADLEAVAAALQQAEPPPAALPEPALPVEALEAAVEAAQPAHEISGPAEPPLLVPAPGEMPVEPQAPEADAEAEPARPRVAGPATAPGAPYRPET